MSMGAQDRDKIIRIGVISAALLVVVVYGYMQLHTPDTPAPPVSQAPTASQPQVAKPQVKTALAVATPTSPGAVPRSALDANAASGPNAPKVGTTASQYDPTLKMEPMLVTESLVYSGSGRNIFSENSAPALTPLPKLLAQVRTQQPPPPPAYTGPPPPPPLPPIDLKFFGTATLADGSRQAFLLHGDDVFLAAPGNIVQRRYKIGAVSAGSVEVEDLTNNNKQNLTLQK